MFNFGDYEVSPTVIPQNVFNSHIANKHV